MNESETPAAEVFSPGEYLRDELSARGWSESEFAEILGRPAQAISEILNDKKEITAETAAAIGAAFRQSAEMWLNLQSAYKLHSLNASGKSLSSIDRSARLRDLVPVRELQKRGWLPNTKEIDDLESAVAELLDINSLDQTPSFAAAARRTNELKELSSEQRAWIARVRQVGRKHTPGALNLNKLEVLAADLSHRIRDVTDLNSLREWFGDVGVVLVFVLPLRNSKIDGVVVWDDELVNPIIGVSTRGDRLDSLIFTLLHEIAHLVLRHVTKGCTHLEERLIEGDLAGQEAEASQRAGQWIVDDSDLPDNEGRKPTMQRIIAVSSGLGIHPSLLIGRLQRDDVLDWADYRRSIPKVRQYIERQIEQ